MWPKAWSCQVCSRFVQQKINSQWQINMNCHTSREPSRLSQVTSSTVFPVLNRQCTTTDIVFLWISGIHVSRRHECEWTASHIPCVIFGWYSLPPMEIRLFLRSESIMRLAVFLRCRKTFFLLLHLLLFLFFIPLAKSADYDEMSSGSGSSSLLLPEDNTTTRGEEEANARGIISAGAEATSSSLEEEEEEEEQRKSAAGESKKVVVSFQKKQE